FKRVIHNQEIQLNELQQKVNQSSRMSADDLLGTHEHTHNIVEETPASEEELVASGESSTISEEPSVVDEEEKVDQQIKNPE
ncbi:MAG: hypothetical protein KAJ92_02355, partial [Gammaproteobacteria bacterium]|nr:hypothetical protein [Gammaproteobacteria bacterium]